MSTDRIVKPDTGNDLVLQNDDGSAKIEINEAGTIVHTGTSSIDVSSGTFTTSSAQKQAIADGATIEAQDLASASGTTLPNNVQDAITRLGTVTSGTFNGTIGSSARANSIQPASGESLVLKEDNGNAALTIDTDGDIQIANNIDTGTFKGTIDSTASMPSGTVIKMGQTKFTSDASKINSTDWSTDISAGAFTPDGGPDNTSTIYPIVTCSMSSGFWNNGSGYDNRAYVRFKIEGDDITNVELTGTVFGGVAYDSGGLTIYYWNNVSLQGVTLDGTGNANITVKAAVKNKVNHGDKGVYFYGNNTFDESYVTFIEVV